MSHHPTDRPTAVGARECAFLQRENTCRDANANAGDGAHAPPSRVRKKLLFARTHARGFRADEASASRSGEFTATHASLNRRRGFCDGSRRRSREKKKSSSFAFGGAHLFSRL